jgi:teichoic acid transport system permease protein
MGNLRAQNASTALGLLWWVLNPLLLAGVYFLVFGVILAGGQRGNPTYLAYLMSGLFAFHYTSAAMNGGANSIISNSKLVSNLSFPRLLLPISGLLEAAIGFLVSVVAFFAIIIPLSGIVPGWSLVMFIPALLLQTIFNLGLSALMARLAVPFRDVRNLIPYATRIWLYLSPIIWEVSFIEDAPDWISTLVRLNPIFPMLELYRAALLGWDYSATSLLVAAAWAAAALLIGSWSFVRFEGQMVQYL